MEKELQRIANLRCCVCDKTVEADVLFEHITDKHLIVRCPECKLTFIHPMPHCAVLDAVYEGLYSKEAKKYNSQKMKWMRKSVKGYINILRKIGHYEKGFTLLDIGGGVGYYSRAFQEVGMDVTLLDKDPVSVSFAREVLRIEKVVMKDLEQFVEEHQAKYDIIFFRHVIEHLREPEKAIERISEILKDGGILIIETNNNASIEFMLRPSTASFFLNKYKLYDPSGYFTLLRLKCNAIRYPNHLYAFRMDNLVRLLERYGLYPVYKRFYRIGHPVFWPNAHRPSPYSLIKNLLKLRIFAVIDNIFDILFLPIYMLLEHKGLSCGLCIYARKLKR